MVSSRYKLSHTVSEIFLDTEYKFQKHLGQQQYQEDLEKDAKSYH